MPEDTKIFQSPLLSAEDQGLIKEAFALACQVIEAVGRGNVLLSRSRIINGVLYAATPKFDQFVVFDPKRPDLPYWIIGQPEGEHKEFQGVSFELLTAVKSLFTRMLLPRDAPQL